MNNQLVTAAGTFAAATLIFGAAALAQTPQPSATSTPRATGTPATVVITATATTAPSEPTFVPTIVVSASLYVAGGGPFAYAHPAFERVWDRSDHPVALGQVRRTFFWGPGPNTPGLLEQYNEDPLGRGQRLVQYFDKSRMELNNPNADPSLPFFVTNGLLTVDLISGSVQVGEKDFSRYRAACIPMSGDFGDRLAPTYFAFQKVSVSADRVDTHPAANRTGQRVTETIDRDGNTGTDASKGNVPGVDLVYFEPQTRHNIPRVFWDFLNASGQTHGANHAVTNQRLIDPWFFASGLPVSEPYWARATIRGQVRDVMIQAYERRALTYVPTNEPGFRVEMANIGQHYFDWRYRNFGICPGQPVGTPTAPVPAPTGTTVPGTPGTPTRPPASPTPEPTPQPTLCPGCPSPTPTATVRVPPGTVVEPTIVTPSPTITRTPFGTPPAGRNSQR